MTHQSTRIVVSIIAVVIIIAVILIHMFGALGNPGIMYLHSAKVKRIEGLLTKNHMMSGSEYEKLAIIRGNVVALQKPTPSDVQYVLDVYDRHKSGSIRDIVPEEIAVSTLMHMAQLHDLRSMPPSVYQRYFSTSVSLLSDKDMAVKSDALNILGDLRDRRAIPYVLPFINSKDLYHRKFAVRSLRELGVKIDKNSNDLSPGKRSK